MLVTASALLLGAVSASSRQARAGELPSRKVNAGIPDVGCPGGRFGIAEGSIFPPGVDAPRDQTISIFKRQISIGDACPNVPVRMDWSARGTRIRAHHSSFVGAWVPMVLQVR